MNIFFIDSLTIFQLNFSKKSMSSKYTSFHYIKILLNADNYPLPQFFFVDTNSSKK